MAKKITCGVPVYIKTKSTFALVEYTRIARFVRWLGQQLGVGTLARWRERQVVGTLLSMDADSVPTVVYMGGDAVLK